MTRAVDMSPSHVPRRFSVCESNACECRSALGMQFHCQTNTLIAELVDIATNRV